MAEINISDSRGRDAVVSAESVSYAMQVRWIDQTGAQAASRKILRSTVPHDLDALFVKAGGRAEDLNPPAPEKGAAMKGFASRAKTKTVEISPEEQDRRDTLDQVCEMLVAGDPEVDIETFGEFLEDSSRVYVDREKQIVHKVTLHEVVRTPEGEIKERRPKQPKEPNVSTEIPIKWTGKKMKKSDVCSRFIFANKVQITHINGLTYDFLFEMAEQLEKEDALMLVAGGSKGNQPLLFRRGGLEYRGFLEGRTEGKKYALILHLTNMELKRPSENEESPKAKPVEKSTPAEDKPAAVKKSTATKKNSASTKKKAPAKKKDVAKKKSPAKKKAATKKKAAKKKKP